MTSVSRKSTTEIATDEIRNSIENGEYEVGDKLATEKQLCELLNVSRTVVREAQRILCAEGYIEIKPGRGAFVARTTPKEDYWSALSKGTFEDVMNVRIPVEELAVRLAYKNRDDAFIAALEKNLNALKHTSDILDKEKMSALDEEFHMLIFRQTQNALLINFGDQIIKAFARFRYASFHDEKNYSNAIEPHTRIIEEFKHGDEDTAAAAMTYHMNRAIEDITEKLNQDKKQETE